MSRGWILVVIVFFLTACAQTPAATPPDPAPAATMTPEPSPAAPDPTVMPLLTRTSTTQSLSSVHVGDDYKIYVSLPEGYDAAAEPGYHVVYVTDGDLYFDGAGDFVPKGGVVKIVSQLSQQGSMPPAIVVGIGYVNEDKRDRDFHIDPDSFIDFLKSELIPAIDNQYNTIPSPEGRTLIGHSWGSYFVLYLLLHHGGVDDPFHNHLAISGFLTSYDRLLYDAEQALNEGLGDGGVLDVDLFMTIGNLEYAEAVDSNIEMHDLLTGRGYQEFRSEFVLYSGQEHYGIVIPAVRTGLAWLFEQ